MGYALMDKENVTTKMFVAEVLERWPGTAAVFQKFKTACVGCAMAPFDTIADVTRIYDLNGQKFLEALRRTAAETSAPEAEQSTADKREQ